MPTTVKIDPRDKEVIRRLQEAWRRHRGEQPTQQEVLAKGLRFLEGHRDAFLAEATWRPITPVRLRALRRRQGHFGKWSVRDLDEIVYGSAE